MQSWPELPTRAADRSDIVDAMRWLACFVALSVGACAPAPATPVNLPQTPTAAVTAGATKTPPPVAPKGNEYPNELAGFRIAASAPWRSLRRLESTMADTRRALGDPKSASDLAHYSDPYPGDGVAEQPVWEYDVTVNASKWTMLVYFVKSDYYAKRRYPVALHDRLLSIDYVPVGNLPFAVSALGSFRKSHTTAADASWDEWTDGSGLIYEVYSKPRRNGGSAGDLNRIVYGPSDEQTAPYPDPR